MGKSTNGLNYTSMKKSGHSHHLDSVSAKYKKILKTIENSLYPITPKEISHLTEINPATVRKYVRTLKKWGFIWVVFYGHYCSSKNIFTLERSIVKSDCPRLHCLRLRIVDFLGSVRFRLCDFGNVRISYQQYNNGTVTIFVDCVDSYSLDYVAFRLLVELIKNELGLEDWKKVTVSSFEFNNDIKRARLDGVQAVTLGYFDGSFRRIYQKRFGLRDEAKIVGSTRVEDVLNLLNGGVEAYNFSQLLFELIEEVKLEREAVKFQSQLVVDAVSLIRRFIEVTRTKTKITPTKVKASSQTETTEMIHHE